MDACLDSKLDFPISRSALEELISFCLLNNCFVFNDIFYSQQRETPMGSSLSVRIAEIVMQKIENEIISNLSEKILFWPRYVDDIFFIAKDSP